MTTDPDPTETGRRWMRGDLASAEYFQLVRQQTAPVRRPGVWARLMTWWRGQYG